MPPFLEGFAAAAKAAGEAAAKMAEGAAAAAKDAGAAVAENAGKAVEKAGDILQDAAGDMALPDDLGVSKLDAKSLPDDVRIFYPDLWNLPDDIGHPFEEQPDIYYERETPEGLNLPDDLGQPELDSTNLPDNFEQSDHPERNAPNDSSETEHENTDLPNNTSKSTGEHERGQETDNPERKMEPPAEVTFKCPEGCDKKEFEKQVKAQEDGLNNMTIDEFLKNREKYKQNGRDTQEGGDAQRRAREKAKMEKINELREQGMPRKEAEAEADKWLSKQAALHNPDQVAGGDPTKVTGVGDRKVNSSIGAQWGNGQADKLEQQVRDNIKENNTPPEDLSKRKMNVKCRVI